MKITYVAEKMHLHSSQKFLTPEHHHRRLVINFSRSRSAQQRRAPPLISASPRTFSIKYRPRTLFSNIAKQGFSRAEFSI